MKTLFFIILLNQKYFLELGGVEDEIFRKRQQNEVRNWRYNKFFKGNMYSLNSKRVK